MSKTILITLNNSGNDPGPYDLTLIDGSNNETPWPSNPVTKAQLTAGYQMVVPDLIVKVKVQSKTCTTYIELTIPTTQCPCKKFLFTAGTYVFTECGNSQPTTLIVDAPDNILYCIDTNEPITQINGPGTFTNTNECCTSSTPPAVITTTTTSTTTTSTTTSTTSTTTSTTSTTTTTTLAPCIKGKLQWNINAIVGARIKITRVSDGAILINQNSASGTPYGGLITNASNGCETYLIEGSWVSGSGNSIKMRICDVANTSEYSFDSGSGPGTSFTHEVTICCGGNFSVYVTAGTAIPPPCPI
jgi:hypothetical protein